LRDLLVDLLCSEGYLVETAAEGAEALRAATRRRPGRILLNLAMPVLDGPGLARELAARGLAVPLVVVSGAWDGARAAAAIGAAGYLAKPFDLDALLALVARLCPAARSPVCE
jgi:two-component system, chemotaxis family, chemotaxis protein CheY